MGTEETRRFKIAWFMARVQEGANIKIPIDKEKLVSEFSIFFGSTKRTGLEILDALEGASKIITVGGMIYTPTSYKEAVADAENQVSEKSEKEGIKN